MSRTSGPPQAQGWDSVQAAQSSFYERRIQAEQAQALQRTVDEKTLRIINRSVIEILKQNHRSFALHSTSFAMLTQHHREHGDAVLSKAELESRLKRKMMDENQTFDEDRDFCSLNEPDLLQQFRRPNSGVTLLQDGKVRQSGVGE